MWARQAQLAFWECAGEQWSYLLLAFETLGLGVFEPSIETWVVGAGFPGGP